MDEPMEETDHGNPINGLTNEEIKSRPSPSLRPTMLMNITNEDYEQQFWPKLESAIHQLLTMAPGDYIPISYEQMYSCVYKCVCKQFSERLYNDLLRQIQAHLERLCLELQCFQQSSDSNTYIDRFNFSLNQYLQALGGIVPIFNYMNRFYVENKLKTDLNVELRRLFVATVSDKHIGTIIPFLVEANSKPFSVSPHVMANLIKSLHSLKPEYAQLRPHLFAKYLPNILPPCTESELGRYIEEARQMQRDLLRHPDFISGDQSKKRMGDEDVVCSPSALTYTQQSTSS